MKNNKGLLIGLGCTIISAIGLSVYHNDIIGLGISVGVLVTATSVLYFKK